MTAINKRAFSAIMLMVLLVASPAVTLANSAGDASPDSSTVVLGTRALNIRECPDLACSPLASVSLGAELTVVGETINGFAPVEWEGHAGWAYDLFLFGADDDRLMRRGIPGCNRVALIFNAGIGEQPSEVILDTLVNTNTPATLFAMGWWAEAWPGYLRAMDDAGVVIGSHGDTQTFLTDASDAVVRSEIHSSANRIESVIGRPPLRYYTAYASDSDERVRQIIAGEGWLPVGWTVSAGDFHDDDTAQGVHDRVMAGVTDGAIIELHLDGPSTAASTAVALPRIIADLKAEGYQFVTIPEIILPCGAG